MILLSKVIKAPFAHTYSDNKKVIQIKNLLSPPHEQQEQTERQSDEQAFLLVEEAKQQAQHIRHEAEAYYQSVQQQILQEQQAWEQEKQQWIEKAQREGYERGLQQGKEEGLQQYQQLLNQAKRVIDSANQQFYDMLQSADETILLVALKVAERIIGERLNENKEHFLSLVKQVIKEVREHEEVKIYVHPSYYDLLIRQKDELKALFSQEAHLFIYPDQDLPETGCVVESPFGRIDASVDTQLEQLKAQLLERIEGEC
ncbi:flagellar assembly protein FliH [Thermolongibacillus altinsuensis]|jgi:flagellar assembly protein FliH|uniref:Flagellar assembly protein FliH n=1 Tax=Thermolongibacillus altinsuensis TaxID=575256 RepID=A0A4R1QF27_9BACL|nr:flagellar assembly protein FliH [Thermolongibacillus altinsuensis]TCL50371.1 flagellar assembly protein FliH [Thermolongibacillus altinsuensis]